MVTTISDTLAGLVAGPLSGAISLGTLGTPASLAAADPSGHGAPGHAAELAHGMTAGPWWAMLILVLPFAAFCLNALFAALNVRSRLPAFVTTAMLAGSFVATAAVAWTTGLLSGHGGPFEVHLFDWIDITWGSGAGESIIANFSFYIDGLTVLWMLFVTGLATLICLYASEYMSHDVGPNYGRFFAAFSLFVVSMTCLVMGDNLLLLYLGWEGVGLCSYLLIGYFFKKPSAREAAKKAFIVNRIGDLGLAIGIYLTFVHFGTLEYAALFDSPVLKGYIESAMAGNFGAIPLEAQMIAYLLMLGAFGKSAQIPLYVWLPDAMEGPTPVSALIHAATMVTAGVYLIARMYGLFLASEYALTVVAWVGTLTALLAATIGMAQFDIKRIMAYSTVSQLGYMFAGLGVLTSVGGSYHVLTHAFFKATLFLACGAVMHGFAGQLSPRKLSGLMSMPGWRITSIAMLVGCLNLAGVPLTGGYFSKDTILAEAFVSNYHVIGWILVFTAGLTAYYTFRVFFRVFVGPVEYEPGDEVHDDHETGEHADHEGDHGHRGDGHSHGGHGHGFHPHAPGWAINTVLAVLAVVSLASTGLYFLKVPSGGHTGGHAEVAQASAETGHGDDHKGGHAAHWTETMVMNSSAAFENPYVAHHGDGSTEPHAVSGPRGYMVGGTVLGYDPHKAMYYLSGVVGLIGILLAAILHGPRGIWSLFLGNRTSAGTVRMDAVARAFGPIPRWAERKWFVDEFYDMILVRPLRLFAQIFASIDRFVVDGIVSLFGSSPRWLARGLRPLQSGELHGYAAAMIGGVGLILVLVLIAARAAGGAG